MARYGVCGEKRKDYAKAPGAHNAPATSSHNCSVEIAAKYTSAAQGHSSVLLPACLRSSDPGDEVNRNTEHGAGNLVLPCSSEVNGGAPSQHINPNWRNTDLIC